jgi:hypothetical protein
MKTASRPLQTALPSRWRQRRALVLALAATPSLPLLAQTAAITPSPELATNLPGATLQGSGRLRFLGLAVYDARLWHGGSKVGSDWAAAPFALELIYARALKGPLIAERSVKEMRRQRDLSDAEAERWTSAMTAIFPDVKEGDRITGFNVPGMGARFAINGAMKGDIRDLEFAKLFFGIWLSEKSSEPALRRALLGTT